MEVPSGKLSHNYGESSFLMGKSTISMAIFNSYVSLPEGNAIGDFNGLYWESGDIMGCLTYCNDIGRLKNPLETWKYRGI